MLAELRSAGLKTVIITNGHAEIQRTKLAACGAEKLFDGILVGGEEVSAGRLEKPHPGIFLAACRLAGCKAHEVRPLALFSEPSTDPSDFGRADCRALVLGVPHWGQPGN